MSLRHKKISGLKVSKMTIHSRVLSDYIFYKTAAKCNLCLVIFPQTDIVNVLHASLLFIYR